MTTRATAALAACAFLAGCGGGSPGIIEDTEAPSLEITSPAQDGSCGASSCSGALVTAATSQPFVVSGSVSDASPFTVRFTVRDGSVVVAGPADATVSGDTWQFPWSVPTGVNGKAYTVEVVATDDKNNAVSRSRTILVDNVPPTASFTAPNPSQLVGSATVVVSGQVADGSSFGIAGAEISTDGATFQALTLTGVEFTTSLPVPSVDHVAQTVTVRVEDLAGNQGTSAVAYFADRVGPTLTISSPDADADCTGAVCTGAVVNLASGASFAISGSASDPSGFAAVDGLVARILDGATEVAGTRAVLSGGSISYGWTGLPADAGKEYTFEIAGVDAAGNVAVTTRALWVDRVAPAVTMERSDQRLVSRTAILATFSEPMASSSVRDATTFSPAAVSTASYGSSDGQAFGFTDPANLLAYRTYTMTIGTGAVDRAGNPIAAATQKFLTETADVTRIPLETDLASYTPALPAIALDLDGKPHVVYQTSSDPVTGTDPRLASWDGRGGAYPANVTRRAMTHGGAAWTAGRATDLSVYANPVDSTTLALDPGLKALVAHSPGTSSGIWQVEYALSADRVNWVGQALGPSDPPTFLTVIDRNTEPCFDDLRGACFLVIGGALASRMLANTIVAPDPVFDRRSYTVNPVAFTSLGFNQADQHRGAATRTVATGGFDVGYFDARGASTVAPGQADVTLVSGRPQLQRQSLGFCLPLPCARPCLTSNLGSAFVAHVTSSGTILNRSNTLSVACNGDPAGTGTWRSATRTLTSFGRTSAAKLVTARSSSTFAVAVALSSGSTFVYRAANDACTAAPDLVAASASIPGSDPAIAVDDAGTVWVAYVSTDPLTQGQLLVEKVAFPP